MVSFYFICRIRYTVQAFIYNKKVIEVSEHVCDFKINTKIQVKTTLKGIIYCYFEILSANLERRISMELTI